LDAIGGAGEAEDGGLGSERNGEQPLRREGEGEEEK